MQWLSLVSEDKGIQSLKAENRLPATTHSVDAISPYPASHASHIGELPERPPATDRRQQDRRKGDRRKNQVPVLLDTRSKHDRRGIHNRRDLTQPDQAQKPQARMHINEYA